MNKTNNIKSNKLQNIPHQLRDAMTRIILAMTLLCCFYTTSLQAQTEDLNFETTSDTVILLDTLQIHHQDTILLNDLLQPPADTIVATGKTPSAAVMPNNAANPHKATLWALIPGGGQVYNWNHGDKAWIASLKLTAIYGGFGTLTYFIVRNTNDYRDFREAYKWVSTEGASGKENKYTNGYAADQLKSYMDYYQTNVEWCYFFTGLLYGLQIVEATVTAHLLTFDVSDNLSFSVRPLYMPDFSTPTFNSAIGFSLRYKVRYK